MTHTALDAATDIIDAAAREVEPAQKADFYWAVMVVAAAAMVMERGAPRGFGKGVSAGGWDRDGRCPMTPQMAACVRAISALTKGDVPPSYRQLAERLGISVGGVFRLVNALKARGFVTFDPGLARSLKVVERRAPGERLDEMSSEALLTLRRHVDAVLGERLAGRAR